MHTAGLPSVSEPTAVETIQLPSVSEPTAVGTASQAAWDHTSSSSLNSSHYQPGTAGLADPQAAFGSGQALEAALRRPAQLEHLHPVPPSGVSGFAVSQPSVSGYYRPERGAVRGLLLALEIQGKGQVAVYRPATGPAARPMRLQELTER